MKDNIIKFIIFFLLVIVAPSSVFAKILVDLTHSYDKRTLYMPAATPFYLKKIFANYTDRGYFYAVNDFYMSEHIGTHIDAPRHFYKKGNVVSKIGLNQLVGAGIVINVTSRAAKNKDYQISIKDFLNWEKANGPIPSKSIILLETGYSKLWPNRRKYLGTSKMGSRGIANLHFPGLSPKAAAWLIKKRLVKAIGIDTASMDFGQTKIFKTHQIFARQNIPTFENVSNLKLLPSKGFLVYALPMKIKGGTGAPIRIVAVL